jgi:glucokinase
MRGSIGWGGIRRREENGGGAEAATAMLLGIEIGGTKLQLGVGDGRRGELVALLREEVAPGRGAAGILEQIERVGGALLERYPIRCVGIGFGGPVEAERGRVIRSHQVEGWEDFALAQWCRDTLGIPATVGNDCDLAALAEARWGAGRGRGSVLYVTVGTGVGGGFVRHGRLLGSDRPAACEIGHLRPGLLADQPDQTVESLASGWGIAAAAQARMGGEIARPIGVWPTTDTVRDEDELRRKLAHAREVDRAYVADLLERCHGNARRITAQMVAEAAEEGNEMARSVIAHACQVLGWAIAQAITLLAPEVVVVGGGVSLMGESAFFVPLRREVARYVFVPLRGTYTLEPAALGEAVVVQGAIRLAALSSKDSAQTDTRQPRP